MTSRPPNMIALDPDDYHAKYVGRTADGRQFFITTHVDTRCAIHGHAFVATYLFNAAGMLTEARVDDVGAYADLDPAAWQDTIEQRFAELGRTAPRRIIMAPFEVERFGLKFGLIARERDDGVWIADSAGQQHGVFRALAERLIRHLGRASRESATIAVSDCNRMAE